MNNTYNLDWKYYLVNNIDLLKAGICTEAGALIHYIQYGKSEGRSPNRLLNLDRNKKEFDWEFYINKYSDLRKANILNQDKAQDHYINYGFKELRQTYNFIPKIAFTYWVGPMSYLHYLTLKTFRLLNPDWQVILYVPAEEYTGPTYEHTMKYTGTDYTDEAYKLNINIISIDFKLIGFYNDVPEFFKSTYVTYYILSKFGGIWFDMDILFIRPMSHLFLSQNDMIYGNIHNLDNAISYEENTIHEFEKKDIYYSTGLLMAKDNSPFFKLLFDELIKNINLKSYMSTANQLHPKLFSIIDDIALKCPNINLVNLPMTIIYPFKCDQVNILFLENDLSLLTAKTIGIHWFNDTSVAKTFLNKMDYTSEVSINNIIKLFVDKI
ncbi:MAG: dTDP-6-deoxy-L-lyxo-4-hexulose reductase [Hyperionvirus sp.]|uniref:dTDP-6-deoxy-L-lyxo-4-hexulose reductase n=1 Tax=Hyperionvirus sp. TaxID=2487770 RepID=A0A3G5A8B2_9VIRU|nr:MAG: dTDP-6-deoxy-L-lyxo-4-hexulose reductase [Hyperionvirus sp.]